MILRKLLLLPTILLCFPVQAALDGDALEARLALL